MSKVLRGGGAEPSQQPQPPPPSFAGCQVPDSLAPGESPGRANSGIVTPIRVRGQVGVGADGGEAVSSRSLTERGETVVAVVVWLLIIFAAARVEAWL